MKKYYLLLLIFITIFIHSQEIKVIEFDNTEDFLNNHYEELENDVNELSKRNFQNHRKIRIYYKGDWRKRICYDCKYKWKYTKLKDYIYYSTYSINDYTFSYGKYRGFNRFNNWYFFELIDWYELLIEDYIKEYNVYIWNMSELNEILYSGAGRVIAKTRFEEFKGEKVKAVDFYYIYNRYIERYSFTIIFQGGLCEKQ